MKIPTEFWWLRHKIRVCREMLSTLEQAANENHSKSYLFFLKNEITAHKTLIWGYKARIIRRIKWYRTLTWWKNLLYLR